MVKKILKENLLTFYHVSFDTENKDNYFIPKIPQSAASDEDKVTPRICLAKDVEHCIQAISASRELYIGSKFILRSVTIPENDKNLIDPETLFINNLVPDATENNEYWYLKPLKFNVSLCEIKDFKFEHVIAWEPLDFKDVKRIIETHIPEFKYSFSSLHPKDVYEEAMSFINKNINALEQGSDEWIKWCEIDDAIYDEIVDLPWAQKIEINDLNINVLDVY